MKRLTLTILLCFGAFLSGCETPPSKILYTQAINNLWTITTEQERFAIANNLVEENTGYTNIEILSVEKWYYNYGYMKINVQQKYRPQFKYKDMVRHIQNPNEFYPNFKYQAVGKTSKTEEAVGNVQYPFEGTTIAGTILVVIEESYDMYELVRIGDGPEHTKTIEVMGNLLKKAE